MLYSIAVIPLGRYISYWNIPLFSYGASGSILTNKDVYTTLVRTLGTSLHKAGAVVEVFRKFDWRQTAMITSLGFCDLDSKPIYDALKVSYPQAKVRK